MKSYPAIITAATLVLAFALTGCQTLSASHLTESEQPQQAKASASSSTLSATLIRVVDGDTIAVEPTSDLPDTGYDEHSVRLLGIDAPEMHKTTNEAPDCGAEAATDHLRQLLASATYVTLVFDPVSDHAVSPCRATRITGSDGLMGVS